MTLLGFETMRDGTIQSRNEDAQAVEPAGGVDRCAVGWRATPQGSRKRGIAPARWWLWLVVLSAAWPANAAAPDPHLEADWERFNDPQIELGETRVELPEGLGPLWLKALRHSESDLRRQAADAVAVAYPHGLTEVEAIEEALVDVLQTPDEHPVARTAAARALVALEARDTASVLAEHTRRGPIELRLVVEPQLARWDYRPAREIWLERLSDASTSAAELQLAIRCLGIVDEARAIPPLKELVLSPTTSPLTRLAAAKALSEQSDPELVEMASQLAGESSEQSSSRQSMRRLIGVHLLAQQSSDAALELLDLYAAAEEPTVAAQAMQRLLEIAPERVVARASETIKNRDAGVRRLTVSALATAPAASSIEVLIPVLNDRVPEIRTAARHVLLTMSADEDLRPEVVRGTVETLQGDAWRGLEQAILILTELDQTQSGERMLRLLHHERPEVYVTAAWGLKKLAIPDLAPPMLEEAQRVSEAITAGGTAEEVTLKLAHLLEAMGPMGYRPADPFLKTFVPKFAPYTEGTRAAAIWSLGFLASESPDPELVNDLIGRLNDANSLPPEAVEVRAMSAVSLGRIKAESALASLRQWYPREGLNSHLGACCAWAVEQITGESIPRLGISVRQLRGWFLEPVE